MTDRSRQIPCCIVGGGPAGMMLGLLLARAGVEVLVLEKHADFLRDFRGDTIHPSTLDLMHELGFLEEFLRRPHQEMPEIRGYVAGAELTIADFRHLPTQCRFIAFMPQWDFLNFLSEKASYYPGFHLEMQAEVTGLLEENGRIVGVKVKRPGGDGDISADLVVGADGRHSTVRQSAGLEVEDLGAPIDVLWMRISRRPSDPAQSLGRFDRGKMMAMLLRDTYWQCGYIISKGAFEAIRAKGLEGFRDDIAALAPFLRDRVSELQTWDQIKLLTVCVDRLRRWWRPGLLCIGDAAHAMSPLGGVGINLAVQDAVAAANRLAQPLKEGRLTEADLQSVQTRRLLPTRLIQGIQVFMQNRVIQGALGRATNPPLAWPLRVLRRWAVFRRIPAYLIGIGFWREHVH